MEDDLLKTLPLVEGVQEALHALHEAGVHINFTTARGRNSVPAKSITDTIYSLHNYGIWFGDVLTLRHKADYDLDLYIDDAPHEIERLRQRNKPVFIFDTPYNRHLDGIRLNGWKDVDKVFEFIENKLLGRGAS